MRMVLVLLAGHASAEDVMWWCEDSPVCGRYHSAGRQRVGIHDEDLYLSHYPSQGRRGTLQGTGLLAARSALVCRSSFVAVVRRISSSPPLLLLTTLHSPHLVQLPIRAVRYIHIRTSPQPPSLQSSLPLSLLQPYPEPSQGDLYLRARGIATSIHGWETAPSDRISPALPLPPACHCARRSSSSSSSSNTAKSRRVVVAIRGALVVLDAQPGILPCRTLTRVKLPPEGKESA